MKTPFEHGETPHEKLLEHAGERLTVSKEVRLHPMGLGRKGHCLDNVQLRERGSNLARIRTGVWLKTTGTPFHTRGGRFPLRNGYPFANCVAN